MARAEPARLWPPSRAFRFRHHQAEAAVWASLVVVWVLLSAVGSLWAKRAAGMAAEAGSRLAHGRAAEVGTALAATSTGTCGISCDGDAVYNAANQKSALCTCRSETYL